MTDDDLAAIEERLYLPDYEHVLVLDCEILLAEVKAGRERERGLREALAPLVAQLDGWWNRVPDDLDVYTAPAGEHWGLDEAIREGGWEPAYTIGDLRRARALLDDDEEDDDGR